MVLAPVLRTGTTNGLWQLPEGWEWVRIDDVCSVNPSRPRLHRSEQAPTSFLPMSGVDEVDGVINALETKPFFEVARGFTYFEEGDVLFAKITPSMENGKSAIAQNLLDKIGFGSTEFHVIRPGTGIIPEWVHLYFRQLSFRLEAKKSFRGAVGQQRVPDDFLKSFPIPVPSSLDTQRRIVTRIQALLAEVKKGRTLIKHMRHDADRLMNAALKRAFDKSTHGLKLEPLAKHVIHVTSGPRHWGQYASSRNSGPLFIRVGNVGFGRLELADVERLDLASNPGEERARINPRDVLVTITGTIGRCCVAPDNIEQAYVNQHVALIRLQPTLDPRYLMWFILSPSGGYIQTTTMQYGQTRPGLNLTNVRNLRLPVPTRFAQQEIVSYLDSFQLAADEVRLMLDRNSRLLEQLEQSILERAFRGEL